MSSWTSSGGMSTTTGSGFGGACPIISRYLRSSFSRCTSSRSASCSSRFFTSADLTDSSVRTLLRRLEQKSYVTHERERKRFIFRAAVERPTAAAAVARRIVKSICGGAVESLLIGMVESRMLSRKELDAARKRLAQLESEARDD